MLQPGPVLGPGTVDDLIADARLLGCKATQRSIMDWQSLGLLDYPEPQGGAGKGRGSKKSLYGANQRKLFRALQQKRGARTGVKDLTVIPVWFWLYWGDDYVPLRQVRVALTTWVRAYHRANKRQADRLADEILRQIDHPDARETARNRLRRLLADAMRAGRGIDQDLEGAVWDVFDPRRRGRALGPPGAQLSPELMVQAALCRQAAVERILRGDLPDEIFVQARAALRRNFYDYLRRQPELAAQAGELEGLFTSDALAQSLQTACSYLVSGLGILLLSPPSEEKTV